jgi:hypothetical protein
MTSRACYDRGVQPDDEPLPSSTRFGPLSSVSTVYETVDGRRCVVTFANRGADALSPVRNELGELWVGFLLDGDRQPERFEDWERAWVAPELLRPAARLHGA